MAQSDDIARIVSVLVRQVQAGKLAKPLRYAAGLTGSAIAKACGVAESVVYAWERGDAEPTTSEGLAWLMQLYPPPRAGQPAPGRAEVDLPPGQARERGRRDRNVA
jgi:transcriptional regulator with XRE-family HTH domain